MMDGSGMQWEMGAASTSYLIAMDLASPPRRVSPARADMVDDAVSFEEFGRRTSSRSSFHVYSASVTL